MAPAVVRVTLMRGRDEELSATEDLITHDLQAKINDAFVERGIVGVFVDHLNWYNGGRAYVEGSESEVRRALETMRTDSRLAPYFSRMVIESPPRAPGPNEAGWKPY
jgi:hypothetical protein